MSHKHIRPENRSRTLYRDACPRHVVTFELDIKEDDRRRLFALDERLRQAGNSVTGQLRVRIEQMKRTKAYRALQKDYGWHAEHMDRCEPDSGEYQRLSKELESVSKRMSAMQEEYGVTWNYVRKCMEQASADYQIPSVFALSRAEDIWQGVQKVLYSDGKNIHFRRYGDLPAMRAKQAERIIIPKVKDGVLEFHMKDFSPMPVLLPDKDTFLKEEYAAIVSFLEHPGQEEEAVRHMELTGEIIPVFRPCYCTIRCTKIRGRLRCYVSVTIADRALPKKDRFGRPRHVYGKGVVGNDIGTQSVAAVSENFVGLMNLGERVPGSADRFLPRKKHLLRIMDRSRKGTNPERFNPDGTYRNGSRGKWVRSNAYRKARDELHELYRKESATRLYANRELANQMRSLGDVLVTEPQNSRRLAKRSGRNTELSDKKMSITKKDGSVRIVTKCRRKRRFGKSILRRSPGQYQAELKKKFGSGYHEVPGNTYRASQYDFMLDQYVRKKLKQRWHILPDGRKVQRDIMSAFLLFCADDAFESIDREKCRRMFDRFWDLHQECISSIVSEHLKICNSGIAV